MKSLIILSFLSSCFMGYPSDYFNKFYECEVNHSSHKDICLEIDKKTNGYPYDINFETEYQKILKERE